MIIESTESHSITRFYFFIIMVIVGLGVLLATLGFRQLMQGQHWTEQMAQSSTRVVKIPAARGNILDRNGVVLVGNRPSYNVALYLDEFGTGRSQKKLLSAVSNSVATLKQRMQMPIRRIDNELVLRHHKRFGPLPLTVWNDLSLSALAAFEENSPWMQGVDMQIDPVRVYSFGSLACHVLGYVGKPETSGEEDDLDFDSVGRRAFSKPSVVGKSGIEYSMDKALQGTPGYRVIKLNAAGLKEKEIKNTLPTAGNNIILSIDQEIQMIVEEALKDAAALPADDDRAFNGRGACVVLDSRNGDVLAMASMPSYDPNLFIPAIKKSDWSALTKNYQKPMLNRAIQGSYNPGSTFKVIGALAALETGTLTPSTHIECTGHLSLGNKDFKCWEAGGHGDMILREAITMSCNVFFYNLGKIMGNDPFWNIGSGFGLGSKTGIPLDHEASGILGNDAWKHENRPKEGRWSTGDSVNMAIGQGFVEVTPIQMAVVASTLANGGLVCKPRMVLEIQTPEGESVLDFEPEIRGKIPVSPKNIQFVREAMANVVENGTAKRLKEAFYKEEKGGSKLARIKVAGKTGSAQFSEPDRITGVRVQQTRAWIISFAPYDEPRYAIAILVEGGKSGGMTAGPLAGTIYRKIFQLEQDRKNPNIARKKGLGRPASVAAIPVSEKVAGFEGEVTGELLESDSMTAQPSSTDESGETEAQPDSVPAEKVSLP